MKYTQEQMEALEARLEALEGDSGKKYTVVTEREGTLREWEGKLIVKTLKVYKKNPEKADSVLLWDLIGWDGEKEEPLTVDYLVFLNNAEKVQAKILDMKETPRTETDPRKGGGGYSYRVNQDTDEFSVEKIALKVGYVDVFPHVELINGIFAGKEVDVDINSLNL